MANTESDVTQPPHDDPARATMLQEALLREADEWERISAGLEERGIPTGRWGCHYAEELRARANRL